MSIRIGFYICHCGINIAYKVRVEEVAEFARTLPNVIVARDYKFMCSDPGQEMIENDIRTFGLNRVVVASCSPRLHEKTFQGACQRAGINPYLFQMASVREQVSWVTMDENNATQKAKTLAAAAVNRVQHHQKLETREVEIHPDIMVLGGGIAGMQSALDIGNADHKVYLVEKSTTIGGHMLQFDKTFPTLDCAACIGTPKMVEVAQNPNIQLLSYSEVKEVSGYVGNYTVKIRRMPRYVKEDLCTGCGECVNVCPVEVPSEWDEKLWMRKAIYRSFPQAVPITFCIDKKDRAPCVLNCPAGTNVQGYIQLISQEKYKEAMQLIMEKIPLPGVLGRVCPHPCENHCRRAEIDSPVAIRDLKRFVADQVSMDELQHEKIKERPEKIAVIGSGPAGLTVAYYSRLKGFQVTIFEALPELGGMLRVGIPDYRLPQDILDKEIKHILDLGVKTRTRTSFGNDFTLQNLKDEGFSAVFLGIGAHESTRLKLPGKEKVAGVIDALSLLKSINLGERSSPGKHVLVIGGGNVAIDAARVCKRLGAESVTVVYRRSEQEMPAYAEEIESAKKEKIELLCLTAPKRIITKNGSISGLECLKTELGSPDDSGRRRPVAIEKSEFTIRCDTVIPAIGQQIDLSWTAQEPTLKLNENNTVQVNNQTMQTSIPFLFSGGDAATGPATVIEAVAAGHKAVEAIEQFIDHTDLSSYTEKPVGQELPGEHWQEIPNNISPKDRVESRHRDFQEGEDFFEEVDMNFSETEAKSESLRCLNCGTCSECMECVKVCEPKAIDHSMKPEDIEIKVGSIILATGYDTFNPALIKQYGYGKYSNVFTSLEFERLSNATGPTGGNILIRDEKGAFTRKPESVAILHCVGSRDINYHEYCSRVCCMYALKYTHLIKEKVGHDTKIYDFYIDQRCFGKGYEEFYRRCQEEGTTFIRGKVAEITDQPNQPDEKGKLVAIAEDTLLGTKLRVPIDMVILCVAMEARKDAQEISRIFNVNLGADGFFLEEHPKLGPLNTATDGIFLAGTCQSPKDIPDTVAQASGAAAKALSLAVRGQIAVPSAISRIDPDICVGCQLCIKLCAYSAIEFDQRRRVSVVNEALCKGCGCCAAACPSSAAQVKHFNPKQLFAEFDGIIDALHAVGM